MNGFTAFLISIAAIFYSKAHAETAFYYTSSPSSYVGAGETKLITTEDFRFITIGSADTGINFNIDNWYPGIPTESFTSYFLNFAAPTGQNLGPGEFLGAVRSPSQPSIHPALTFAADGRGDNRVTGNFRVLEAAFGPDFQVSSFAADFIQYDEGNPNWWNIGQIRYNSSIPIVPESSSGTLFMIGLIGLAVAAKRRRFFGNTFAISSTLS